MNTYKKGVLQLLMATGILLLAAMGNQLVDMNRIAAHIPKERMATNSAIVFCTDLFRVKEKRTASDPRVVNYNVLEKKQKWNLSEQDKNVLLRIVEAEAGCEDDEGKLLVANVVLNRVENSAFPPTVTEVVYQKEHGVSQFSPAGNGRIDQVKVSEETKVAVERALEGEDISMGALYFMAQNVVAKEKMAWFENHLNKLFVHGGHTFYS